MVLTCLCRAMAYVACKSCKLQSKGSVLWAGCGFYHRRMEIWKNHLRRFLYGWGVVPFQKGQDWSATAKFGAQRMVKLLNSLDLADRFSLLSVKSTHWHPFIRGISSKGRILWYGMDLVPPHVTYETFARLQVKPGTIIQLFKLTCPNQPATWPRSHPENISIELDHFCKNRPYIRSRGSW